MRITIQSRLMVLPQCILMIALLLITPACSARDEFWTFHQPQDATLWERALSPGEADVILIHNDLPLAYRPQNYRPLLHLFLKALRKATVERTVHPTWLPDSLTNLGILYYRMADQDRSFLELSQEYLAQALDLRKNSKNLLEVADRQDFLAQAYRRGHKYEAAERLYKSSISLRKSVLPPDHPDLAGSYQRLANLYRDQLRDKDAEHYYELARDIVDVAAFVDTKSGGPRDIPTSIHGARDSTLPEMVAFARNVLGREPVQPGRLPMATIAGTLLIPMDSTPAAVTREVNTEEYNRAGDKERILKTKNEVMSDREKFRVYLCSDNLEPAIAQVRRQYANENGLSGDFMTSTRIQARELLDRLSAVAGLEDELTHEVRTNRDGEYLITQVEEGTHCLFGELVNGDTAVYWLFPFAVKEHETITFDFDINGEFGQYAHVIWHKSGSGLRHRLPSRQQLLPPPEPKVPPAPPPLMPGL